MLIVTDKSRKKFAPKAPVRRAAAASRTATSTKPSVERQTSQTPQPSASKAPSVAPSTSAAPDADISHPTESEVQQPTALNEPPNKEPSIPAPEKGSAQPSETAIPVPITASRHRTPTPIVPSTSSHPRQSLPTPAPSDKSPEATAQAATSSSRESSTAGNKRPVEPKPTRIQPAKKSVARPAEQITPSIPDDAAQIRPAKRRKTSEITTSTSNETPATNHDTAGPAQPAETRGTSTPNEVNGNAVNAPKPKTAAKKVRKPTKPRKKPTAEEAAAMVVDGAVGKKPGAKTRRRRASTPEDAETVEITPTVVKMSDLCRDLPRGKKSKREIELRNMDRAEAERKRNGVGKESESSTSKENTEDVLAKADEERDRAEAESQAGPQMRIVNGEIVLDSSSLQIDRHANAARNAEDLEEVEENPLTRRINAGSFAKRSKPESWDEEMTDLFYRGLRMFGTDFMMISKMFPGRTRRQIKLKFGSEERKYPERIKETLLGPRESVSLEAYSELTNTVYDDPKIIQQELDEEKKRIEEEHAKEKEAQQELLHNPGGNAANEGDASENVLPSIENGPNGVPKKPRKKNAQNKKFGGGTEEVLGEVDVE